MEILNPTIEWMGVEIREPVTSATDLLTGIVSITAFILLTLMKSQSKVVGYIRAYFLLMATSMAFAATAGHAFQGYLAWEWKMVGWSFGALAICMMEFASITLLEKSLGEKYSRWLKIFAIFHLALFFISIANPETRSFSMVKINSTVGLICIVLPLQAYNYFKHKDTGSGWILFAMLWTLIPAYVYNMEISYSRWLNFHDISHLLMAIYTIYLYFGAKNFVRTT